MHTSLPLWQIGLLLIVFVLMHLAGAFRLSAGPITIRCTSCNHPKSLPWDEATGNFDMEPLAQWIFHREYGWRCEKCEDGPPQHYPDLFPREPAPHDDVH